MKKIRIGIIGIGNHARENLIPALQNIDEFQINAICSRDIDKAKRLAEEFNCENFYTDVEDLIQSQTVDAVVVSATPEYHTHILHRVLKSNLHIFVEKPPFDSKKSFEQFLTEFKNSDFKRIIQFGYNFRHSDFFTKLSEITNGFSDTQYLKIRSFSSKPQEPMWKYSDVYSSSLYAIHIHAIEILCYLFGKVKAVQHQITWLSKNKYISNLIINFDGGKTGVLEMSNTSNRFEFDTELIEKDGSSIKVSSFNKFEIHGKKYLNSNLFKQKEVLTFEIPFLKGGFERTGYSTQFIKFASDMNANNLDKKSINSSLETYNIIQKITENE